MASQLSACCVNDPSSCPSCASPLAQIGEFVFVLLSVASQQELIDQHVYLLLMGELQRCAMLCCAVLVQQLSLPHTCY